MKGEREVGRERIKKEMKRIIEKRLRKRDAGRKKGRGWLVGWLSFYDISTHVGYSMTNPVHTYKHKTCTISKRIVSR